MNEPCKVIRVIVDKIPTGCGDCPMMQYIRDTYAVCVALPEDRYELVGNPYNMMYRRSDCPLCLEHRTDATSFDEQSHGLNRFSMLKTFGTPINCENGAHDYE